jgi:hypothetical protein
VSARRPRPFSNSWPSRLLKEHFITNCPVE